MKERVWKFVGIRILLQACLGAYRGICRVANKLAGQLHHRLRVADAVVVQESIVRRADTHGASFEPVLCCCIFVLSGSRGGGCRAFGKTKHWPCFHSVLSTLKKEVPLGFRTVLASISPCLIRAMAGINTQHIDAAGRVYGKIDVVWYDPLIIFW